MKKLLIVLFLASIFFAFYGCIKDDVAERYAIYTPVYRSKAEVFSDVRSGAPAPLKNIGKLFIKDKFTFVNEVNEGVHIIDHTDPSKPVNRYFIKIPGNVDIAVRDHYLYADCYTHLLVIDIADPSKAILKKTISNVFPHRAMMAGVQLDTSMIVTGWKRKDTIIRKDLSDEERSIFIQRGQWLFSASSSFIPTGPRSSNGIGGSMARFALSGDRLYTVTDNDLRVFNTTQAGDPFFVKSSAPFTSGIETIYPFKDRLFIGTTTGMHIFSINDPDSPTYISGFAHWRACDPVIADDEHAYVTLSGGRTCGGNLNQLDVIDIKNLPAAQLKKTYPLVGPKGLSKENDLLFVCDGTDGMKIYNASNVLDLKLIRQFRNVDAYDVIAFNGMTILVAKQGLFYIDHSNPADIRLKGEILIN